MRFTKRKFLSLPDRRKQRQAAKLLREAYEAGKSLDPYEELAGWLALPPLPDRSREALSNRYHYHLTLASCNHREHNLLPRVRQGDRHVGAEWLSIDIYLDHMRSAHNVGSIVRSTEAFRLGRLCLSDQTPDLESPKVRAASMGAWQWVEWLKIEALSTLRGPIIALETTEKAVPIAEFTFPKRFTLAVGNEEYGLSAAVLAAASAFVEIPLYGRKNSLNVANSFAVAAAEIRRQQ